MMYLGLNGAFVPTAAFKLNKTNDMWIKITPSELFLLIISHQDWVTDQNPDKH